VVSAGAVILGADSHLCGRRTTLEEIEERVGQSVARILLISREDERSPFTVASREAERCIRVAREARDQADDLEHQDEGRRGDLRIPQGSEIT